MYSKRKIEGRKKLKCFVHKIYLPKNLNQLIDHAKIKFTCLYFPYYDTIQVVELLLFLFQARNIAVCMQVKDSDNKDAKPLPVCTADTHVVTNGTVL